jgi:hypothetical protein
VGESVRLGNLESDSFVDIDDSVVIIRFKCCELTDDILFILGEFVDPVRVGEEHSISDRDKCD